MDEPCIFEQAMNHISLKKSRPTCYAKSSTVLNAFQPIPSLISCAGWPGGEDCYLMYKCSQVADLIHGVGGSFLNVAAFHAAVLQNLYCCYHVLLSVHIYVHTQAPKVPVPWHYCILWVICIYQWKHAFFSTGKDASSCVVHLINDGVVVNRYDVSIQFLGSRNVRSYLCKLDDGNFYPCERNRYEQLHNIYKLNTVPINC